MYITSARRNALRDELLSFVHDAQEMRNRFHWFLEQHDPRGYADYSIMPFAHSKAPLDASYFKVDVEDKALANLGDFVDDDEPIKHSLLFKGPDSKHEINCTALAYRRVGPQDDEYPSIYKLQVPWNDNKLYIRIPDDYLDDPNAWENRVLDALAVDRKNAHQVLVHLFGADNVDTLTYKTALMPYFKQEYIEVHLDRESLAESHWAMLEAAGMDTSPVEGEDATEEGATNAVIVSFSRTKGSVFLGPAPRKLYGDPAENDFYAGNIRLDS